MEFHKPISWWHTFEESYILDLSLRHFINVNMTKLMTSYILNAEVSTNSEVLLLNLVEQQYFKDLELPPKQ